MFPLWLETFLLSFVEGFGISIALFILLSENRRLVNQLFFIMVLFLLAYLGSVFVFHRIHLIIFEKLGYAFVALFFIPAYYFLVVYFPKKTKKRNFTFEIFLIIILFSFACLASTTDLIVKPKIDDEGIVRASKGELALFYFSFSGFLVLFYLYSFLKKYFTLSQKEKKKIFWFLLGVLICGTMNIAFNIIPRFFYEENPYSKLGHYSIIFVLIGGEIAIARYRLFNLRVIGSQIIVGLILSFLILNFFLYPLTPFLDVEFWDYQWILKIILFLATLFVSYFLINSTIKETQQKEELEKLNQKLKEMMKSLEEKVKERTRELEEAKTVLEIKVKARTRELEELNKMLEERVKQRTKELQEKVEELEKFQEIALGREWKIAQLKKEIEALKEKLKEKNKK